MDILKELRRKYPIGTKVYPGHLFTNVGYFIISTDSFLIHDDFCYARTIKGNTNKGTTEENGTLSDKSWMRVVWSKNEGFAKIKQNIYELWK